MSGCTPHEPHEYDQRGVSGAGGQAGEHGEPRNLLLRLAELGPGFDRLAHVLNLMVNLSIIIRGRQSSRVLLTECLFLGTLRLALTRKNA